MKTVKRLHTRNKHQSSTQIITQTNSSRRLRELREQMVGVFPKTRIANAPKLMSHEIVELPLEAHDDDAKAEAINQRNH